MDNEVRGIRFDSDDAYCLDQKRLVVIATNGSTIEYRTFPDTTVNVIGHFEDPAASFFEVVSPDGRRMLYGSTAATRPMANTRVPRAWLADVQTDPRGNEVHYDWCFAEDESGYVAEYALTSIRYAPDRAVVFSYDPRDDVRTTYVQGMQLQQSLQLAEVEMQAAGS